MKAALLLTILQEVRQDPFCAFENYSLLSKDRHAAR